MDASFLQTNRSGTCPKNPATSATATSTTPSSTMVDCRRAEMTNNPAHPSMAGPRRASCYLARSQQGDSCHPRARCLPSGTRPRLHDRTPSICEVALARFHSRFHQLTRRSDCTACLVFSSCSPYHAGTPGYFLKERSYGFYFNRQLEGQYDHRWNQSTWRQRSSQLDRRPLAELNQGGSELIRTGIYSPGASIGGKDLYYDDPKARQREAKSMSSKRREKFAKWYLRKVFEAGEQRLWFQKMLKK